MRTVLLDAPVAERRWYRIPSLVAGICIMSVIVALAILAPLLTPFDPTVQDLHNVLDPPSSEHPLGTDQLGRDVWSRLLYGARVDLRVASVAVIFPFIIGTTLGCLAGYYRGWVDAFISRLIDIVVAFPFYVLLIALVAVLGPGTRSIYVSITLVGWVAYARIVRAEVLVVRNLGFVSAARVAGLSDARVMRRHVIPNVITQAIVFAMSDVILTILAIVTLGYLGLGVQPPTPDWGGMISDGQPFITTDWWLSTIPGVAIVLTGLGLSLLGDGLADLMRPS